MSIRPYSLETTGDVIVDVEDVLEYVEEHRDWFMERIGAKYLEEKKSNVQDLICYMENIIDKYNKVRIMRDTSADNKNKIEVQMYEELLEIKRMLEHV